MYTKIFFMALLFAISGVVHAVSTLQAGDASESTSKITISEPIIFTATTPTVTPDQALATEPPTTLFAPPAASIIADVDRPSAVESIIPADPRPHTKPLTTKTRSVPFYSQFTDISAPEWQKVGCGIASLAMLVEYYRPNSINVDRLLAEGIAADAYLSNAGWIHAGLIGLAGDYSLTGQSHDMAHLSMSEAFTTLEAVVAEGPVMVSVHYTFDPQNPIPHLVVVHGVENGNVLYNDPAEAAGNGSISIAKFQSAWKKRYIAIRPPLS